MSQPPESGRTPHVILVGLPGSGKSTIGRRAARQLGWRFVDFDREIQRRQGTSISEIFARQGEARFRQLELDLTRELANEAGAILAPGGGWIATPGTVALLRPPARMIYLRVTPEVAILRMGKNRMLRPLLSGSDPVGAIRSLLRQREHLYLQADSVIDVDLTGMKRVIDRVIRLAGPQGPG